MFSPYRISAAPSLYRKLDRAEFVFNMVINAVIVVLTSAAMYVLLSACTITVPVGGIDLSGCMQKCTNTSRACLDKVNVDLHTCVDDADLLPDFNAQRTAQEQCVYDLSKQAEDCSFAQVDCITACIADAEKTLKGAK